MIKVKFTQHYSYRCKKDKNMDSWDIYRGENTVLAPFATGISENMLEETIERHEQGDWCDFCRCDGLITNEEDGSCVTCDKCDN